MENGELIVYMNRAKDDSMEIHEQIFSSVFPRLIMAWFSIHRTRSASLYAFQQCKCLFHNLHSSTGSIYCAVRRQIRIFENRVKLTFPWSILMLNCWCPRYGNQFTLTSDSSKSSRKLFCLHAIKRLKIASAPKYET